MTSRWENALDAQLELSARLGSNDDEREYTRGFLASFFDVGREAFRSPDEPYRVASEQPDKAASRSLLKSLVLNSELFPRDIYDMPDALAAMAYNADTVYVDPDMMTLWEGLLDTFEAEPLLEPDLIAPGGFLYLPRPFTVTDVHGKRVSTRAVMWAPMVFRVAPDESLLDEDGNIGGIPAPVRDDGVALQYDTDHVRLATLEDASRGTDIRVPLRRDAKSFTTRGILFSAWHDTADTDDYSGPGEWPGLRLNHIVPWPYGSDWGKAAHDHSLIPNSIFAWQAMWRLMQQKIAFGTLERPGRDTRRRLARAKWPERSITVIKLRRAAPKPFESEYDGDPEEVEWSHRWLVRPHWKWQYYPSVGMHRQILIAEYVKGPEDAPLITKKGRVFEVVR